MSFVSITEMNSFNTCDNWNVLFNLSQKHYMLMKYTKQESYFCAYMQVCVLCGYGGGAMTRALKSRNIVRSLLKVWKVGLEFKPMESFQNETREPSLYDEASRSSPGCGSPRYPGTYYGDVPKVDLQDQDMKLNFDNHQNNLQADNTIINGVYDPCLTQWVHMVCGLWTPGTRCPNVDTMNAFDVSGASPARNGIVRSFFICISLSMQTNNKQLQ